MAIFNIDGLRLVLDDSNGDIDEEAVREFVELINKGITRVGGELIVTDDLQIQESENSEDGDEEDDG